VLVSRHLLRPSETPTKILEQNREAMFDLYDRMAKSFVFEDL
jgi:hypothetical protein